MNIWKKLLCLTLLAALMTTGFAGCSKQNADSDLAYIQDKGTLVIGITDYAPMNYRDADGSWIGFDTEFAQAVAEKLGVKAEFVEIEWDNKIFELESKSLDCVWNGMTLTDEVKNAMATTKAYIKNAQVLVMNKDVIDQYKDAESLADVELVAEAGSAGEAAIKDSGLACTAVGTQADALLEVASGSADGCVIDITMANAMTGEGTSYQDLAAGISLTSEEYGIGFRKDSDMAEQVDKIMDELIKDGTLNEIAAKYDLTANLVSNQS